MQTCDVCGPASRGAGRAASPLPSPRVRRREAATRRPDPQVHITPAFTHPRIDPRPPSVYRVCPCTRLLAGPEKLDPDFGALIKQMWEHPSTKEVGACPARASAARPPPLPPTGPCCACACRPPSVHALPRSSKSLCSHAAAPPSPSPAPSPTCPPLPSPGLRAQVRVSAQRLGRLLLQRPRSHLRGRI